MLPPEAGWMLQPGKGNRPHGGRAWAADTGMFSRPERYTDDGYLRWLDGLRPYAARCLFACAPDAVGDAQRTLDLAAPMLPRLRAAGWPAALVAQDGLEALDVPWDDLDCLFTGGTTRWKLSEPAFALQRKAHDRGKWTHLGRTNSRRRLRAAVLGGYDSADGTHTVFEPTAAGLRVADWFRDLRERPLLTLRWAPES